MMIADKAWGLKHVVLFHRYLAMKSLASAWKESQAVAFLLSPLGGELYHYAATISVVCFTNCFNIALRTLFRFQQLSQSKVRWLDSKFLQHPLELRLDIYDIVFNSHIINASQTLKTLAHSQQPRGWKSDAALHQLLHSALLQTCHAILSEASSAHDNAFKAFLSEPEVQRAVSEHLLDSRLLDCIPAGVDASVVRKMDESLVRRLKGLVSLEKVVRRTLELLQGGE
jgi:hypothetical protein